jgi:hypothetical protein
MGPRKRKEVEQWVFVPIVVNNGPQKRKEVER